MRYTPFSLPLVVAVVGAVEIVDLQGPAFRSPYEGTSVTSVTGVVTANGTSGFYLTSSPRVQGGVASDSIYVFTTSKTVLAQVARGDLITLNGRISEYRSSTDYLFLTEITSPSNITKRSTGNVLDPIILGKDGLHPPTQLYSALDVGGNGPLSVPNNVSQITNVNATLVPDKYGLDFWESLSGKLVKVTGPVSVGLPNRYGEFWIRGDWPVTGLNERGGLTITVGEDGIPDLNPETVMIGSPLDGTKNPDVWLGSTVTDITGVVTYQFGFYYILPLTAPTVIAHNTTLQGPTTLTVPTDDSADCTLVFGDYNVENMTWNSTHLPTAAEQIATMLKTPDLIFLQEIQDDSGPNDDGVVTANKTLSTLVSAIAQWSNVTYEFAYVPPVNNQDGGQPGGNIRVGFLYRPERLRLVNPNVGGSTDAVQVSKSGEGIALNFNPGRLDPTNSAWEATRKPLVALFELIKSGAQFLAINVHNSSKGGSSSAHGNPRPPVNSVVDKRIAQVGILSSFADSVLAINPNFPIIASGDFNEYGQTSAVFGQLEGKLKSIDEAAGIPPVERYTYLFDMNSQQLDHAFISKSLEEGAEAEHLHLNNWVAYSKRTSDHDPSVSRVKVCKAPTPPPPATCTTFQVGSYCAAVPVPYNNLSTCVSSAAACWNDSWTCYSKVAFPDNLQCAKQQGTCTKQSAACTKCILGKCP